MKIIMEEEEGEKLSPVSILCVACYQTRISFNRGLESLS
jgi:hypothetical protein